MGYGGHVGIRSHHVGVGHTYHRRPVRRHYHGYAYSRTYYNTGTRPEQEQQVPVLPEYTVIYEVTSQFQTLTTLQTH